MDVKMMSATDQEIEMRDTEDDDDQASEHLAMDMEYVKE
jgi:DNA-directed RNA polymerase subunit beta